MHGLRSPQIHAIDPLRVHFSLHDLGEYEACQAELRALLAFEPVIARPLPKGAAGADEKKKTNRWQEGLLRAERSMLFPKN